MSETLKRYIETEACLIFELRFSVNVHSMDFKNGYIIKCIIEIKQGVRWVSQKSVIILYIKLIASQQLLIRHVQLKALLSFIEAL